MATNESTGGRRYRGISGEERKEERRLRLVRAGEVLFGDKGYHAATVRGICQAAGVTERYFYESFANGEDLFCATYQLVTEQLRGDLMGVVQGAPSDPEQLVEALMTAFFRFMREHPHAARIMFIEVLGISPRVDRLYRDTTEAFSRLLIMVGRTLYGAEEGVADGFQDDWLATGLVGAVIIITHRWILEDFKTEEAVVVRNALAIFLGVARSWLQTMTR